MRNPRRDAVIPGSGQLRDVNTKVRKKNRGVGAEKIQDEREFPERKSSGKKKNSRPKRGRLERLQTLRVYSLHSDG